MVELSDYDFIILVTRQELKIQMKQNYRYSYAYNFLLMSWDSLTFFYLHTPIYVHGKALRITITFGRTL